jgi:hypothetical protein
MVEVLQQYEGLHKDTMQSQFLADLRTLDEVAPAAPGGAEGEGVVASARRRPHVVLLQEFHKYRSLVEKTIDLQQADQHLYLIKASFNQKMTEARALCSSRHANAVHSHSFFLAGTRHDGPPRSRNYQAVHRGGPGCKESRTPLPRTLGTTRCCARAGGRGPGPGSRQVPEVRAGCQIGQFLVPGDAKPREGR